MAKYRTILTNIGRQLVAAAAASGQKILLTHMAVGDGSGNPYTPWPEQTILAREWYRYSINQLIQDPDDLARFEAELIIPASAGGFVIREVGLFTADGDLFAVGNVPDTYKPNESEGAYSDTAVRVAFLVANADVVNLVIDPNVTVATHTWVINNVDAATVIPGGQTGQVLRKKSNADGDTEWGDPGAAVEFLHWSIEETQTLAASQTLVDLAVVTTEGCAVYIEGVRLRADQFAVNTATRLTLSASWPAGSKVTVVQNEEVGKAQVLLKSANLSDVADKAAARTNLGLPNWLAGQTINWSQLSNIPAFGTRWPTFAEVSDRPASYPASPHRHKWGDLDNVPAFASRWPTFAEVTGKPATWTPSAHMHNIADVVGLAGLLDQRFSIYGGTVYGSVAATGAISAAGGFDVGSSLRLKHIDGPLPYGLSEVERMHTAAGRYREEYSPDGRRRLFLIAEQLAELVPEAVDMEGAEINGEKVPAIKLEQLLPVLVHAIQELAAQVRALEQGR